MLQKFARNGRAGKKSERGVEKKAKQGLGESRQKQVEFSCLGAWVPGIIALEECGVLSVFYEKS
jgi:hypothetical protein